MKQLEQIARKLESVIDGMDGDVELSLAETEMVRSALYDVSRTHSALEALPILEEVGNKLAAEFPRYKALRSALELADAIEYEEVYA